MMEGIGVFVWPDGKKFMGYYAKDKKNGFGTYHAKNGNKYQGKFKKGKQHGLGIIRNNKGEMQLGLYNKGKKIKELNKKDFVEDILEIEKAISTIENFVKNEKFFTKDFGETTPYFTVEGEVTKMVDNEEEIEDE